MTGIAGGSTDVRNQTCLKPAALQGASSIRGARRRHCFEGVTEDECGKQEATQDQPSPLRLTGSVPRPPVVALAFVPGRTPVPRGFAFLRFHITQQEENSVYGRRSGALVQVYSAIDVLIRRNLWNTEARLIRARKKL